MAAADTAVQHAATDREAGAASATAEQPGSPVHSSSSPPAVSEYGKPSYWDKRFEREQHHEWLGGYSAELRDVLHAQIQRSARVLVLGNGTSRMPLDMARDGYSSITATDISTTAVNTMQAEARQQGLPQIRWQQADMMALPFAAGSFDAVLEKGTLDVLFVDVKDPWHVPEVVQQRVDTTLGEIHR